MIKQNKKIENSKETQRSLLHKKNCHYTGVIAPVYLVDDPWFGPAPIKSQTQIDYIERETQIKMENNSNCFDNVTEEPIYIHELMYKIATKNNNTTIQLNPIGGSDNFQEGLGSWS